MKNIFSTLVFLTLYLNAIVVNAQGIQSPSEFLGYPLGSNFTYHFHVIDYLQHIATQSENVQIQTYGKTYEGRKLEVAFISSPKNLENLEQIRINNLRKAGFGEGPQIDQDISIVWFSYNVHGNEASSTETAMKVLHELASKKDTIYTQWLEKLIIIIDPCLNPDGRERYVNWYHQVAGAQANAHVLTTEHQENWRDGRSNHYLYDLNRDWVWQTQTESQQRLKLYNAWLPQVHVDFHEQYYNNQYFFAPAAQPRHEMLTDWQNEFQQIIGKNNSNYFDTKGWLYFTRETYDLLYPGYGDTYPTYTGAIGMTYEMAGNSEAGLAIITEKNDTLTLAKRISMHFATSMTTLETCYNYRQKLNAQFSDFFIGNRETSSYYVLKTHKAGRIEALTELLDKNGIRYSIPNELKTIKAFSYEKNAEVNIKLDSIDLVVSLDQPKATLAKVLFERNTHLSDSLTYDITAWSLPYAYGLDAYLFKGDLDTKAYKHRTFVPTKNTKTPYAYLLNWSSTKDAAFLSAVLTKDYKLNYSTVPFRYNGIDYCPGSLIISKIDNQILGGQFDNELQKLANTYNRNLVPVFGGSAIPSMDLGSQKISYLKKPKIALLSGDGISTLSFGEIWHFFDQEIKFGVDVVDMKTMKNLSLQEYDVLILPSGEYDDFENEDGFKKINEWIEDGGNLVLFENAINSFVGDEKFALKKNEIENKEDKPSIMHPYEESERESLREMVQGVIIKARIDNTHPLAYGYGDDYYTLKTSGKSFKYLKDGWNVGYIGTNDQVVAGYVGSEAKMKMEQTLLFGVENRGRGNVVYFVDDPLFRGFWQNGKLFVANAVFFVD